jgi:hypothetical protein
VNQERKSLLVRADFVLGKDRPADRLSYRRWRKILTAALPSLLGYSRLCPTAEHVCLHDGEQEGHFTAWLRLPVRRRPSRRSVRQLAGKLYRRLEAGLRPIHGEVLKVGIRRQFEGTAKTVPAPEFMPLFRDPAPSSDVLHASEPAGYSPAEPECVPAA